MKPLILAIALLSISNAVFSSPETRRYAQLNARSFLVETEDFQFPGEWTEESGALSLGNKNLVTQGANADAVTVVALPTSADYRVWVRTRDFDVEPGKRRFKFAIDDVPFDHEFGAHGFVGWKWEKAGQRTLAAGDHVLALRDTARFFGRADAIFLTTEDIDPNTLTNAVLAARRTKPKRIEAERIAPFAPAPAIAGEFREVARLENEAVRVRFLSAPDAGGKSQISRETALKVGGAWRVVPQSAEGEKLFVLFTPRTEIRGRTMLPMWITQPSNAPLYRFMVGGKNYEAREGGDNPFFAAPVQRVLAREARQVNAQAVELSMESTDGTPLKARWELPTGAHDLKCTLEFRVPRDGFYSFGFSPFGGHTREQTRFVLLPPLYQFQRLPDTPTLLGSNATPQPLAIAQIDDNGQALSFGVVADPERLPFEWATAQNSVYGFSLLNADKKVQPTIFSPVLGLPSSQWKAGETRSVSWRVLAFPGDWKAALEHASEQIFQVRDYRKPYGVPLSEAALNMVDLIKHDEASGWDAFRKGFVNIEAFNISSQASPLTVLSAAILTRDEELYVKRALPTIEYTLSRPGAHWGTEVPTTFPSYINEEGIKITVPSDFYGAAYWQGLHDLLGRANPWIADLAFLNGKPRYRTAYSSMPRWSELLGAYRLKPDAALLEDIKRETDLYLAKDVYGPQTRELGVQPFYNVSFYPYWWDLLDLYEITSDKKYLDAAQEGAFGTMAGMWSQPRVPPGEVTLHPGGQFRGEPHMWWKGDKKFRLGVTPEGFTGTVAAPEKQVPAWLVSQVGLGLEQPVTYYTGNGGMRNIMMAAWAPNLLRLHRYTGREIFRTYARNSVISRFGNYPGYYLTGFTDLHLTPDYPYRGPDVTSIYYHHIPPHLAFTVDFLMTQAEARSNGQIKFPWVKQQGYVWFSNRLYGHAPGTIFGDATARLWLRRANFQNPALNVLMARGFNRLWMIVMNESENAVSQTVPVDRSWNVNGETGALFDAAGKSQIVNLKDLSIEVPAKGLIALSFASTVESAPAIPPVQNGRNTQTLPGDWGKLEAFRIRSPWGKDSLYVVLTGRPKNGAATLQLNGASFERLNYPFEWSVYPLPINRPLEWTLQLKNADGTTHLVKCGI